ncbi:MAG: hypothetical protein MUE97_04890, partial [Phycisphaerales bacterium]|nr:hypothetical protein [Phycisphaerales bacterium]
WYAGPAGDIRLPGAGGGPVSSRVDLSDLNADSPRVSPFAGLAIRSARDAQNSWLGSRGWLFTAQGAGTGLDATVVAGQALQLGTLAVAPGDALRVEVDLASFEAAGGLTWRLTDFGEPSGSVWIDASALVGVRVVEQRFEVSRVAGGATARMEDVYAAPLVGTRVDVQLGREFGAQLRAAIGAWPDRSSFDVETSFTWRPMFDASTGAGQWLGVTVGYRLLSFDYTSGEGGGSRSYSGSLAGLFGGVTLQF